MEGRSKGPGEVEGKVEGKVEGEAELFCSQTQIGTDGRQRAVLLQRVTRGSECDCDESVTEMQRDEGV